MHPQADPEKLEKIAAMMRYYILAATTRAGSGHPTSSLSATELMTGLFFGGFFRYDADNPGHPNNDRLIFSKGHASPLFYALWVAAGKLDGEEFINTYRKMGSPLEGHPTVAYPYVEAATGSLGQGLSIGVGLALNAKYLDKLPYITYVLLGDSEMAEGSQWEALEIAAYYKLDNLIGILDVNRLGQRGETMYGWNLEAYQQRIAAFGWETFLIDGHSFPEILAAYKKAGQVADKPAMIIAKTIKGKGVSFLENKNGWHGVALKPEELERAIPELGEIDKTVRGKLIAPEDRKPEKPVAGSVEELHYPPDKPVPTRNAYGNALRRLYPKFPDIVSLDGEVSNSTRAEYFEEKYPDRFFEMFIAEQNMVGAALGLACRGKIPFVSTFAAFLTRAFDQIRMSQYSETNIKFVGSHAGVSIGEDGPSQMGLEDLAMMRAILNSVVLYPCDAVATERLVEEAAKHQGIVYIRTTRAATPIHYGPDESFPIGGCKVLKRSGQDVATVVTAGITVFEALKAHAELEKAGINIRVIDLYSIKPLDAATLMEAARETKAIITVEDHYAEGGLGEAVSSCLCKVVPALVHILAVRRKPQSGKPEELLDYEEISQKAIIKQVKRVLNLP
ncbi:MAG: transketolase [Deltaproteobacteria bacterium]|nr:transketolase [Desulfitobacteriaceae bacterium]MDI6854835.1 transketolase [Deltaproteobacteria bacterium]